MKKHVLLTGGAGYIGSHAVCALADAGYVPVIFDNLSNSDIDAVDAIEKIIGYRPEFIEGDVRDFDEVCAALKGVSSVIHFAGLKSVGESVENPLSYYDNNVCGSVVLLRAMEKCGVHDLVFSSSATVYGVPKYLPLDEKHPISAVNPYGQTKIHIEEMLRDLAAANSKWRIFALRYFNPVGAHESGLIGENPSGVPNNLMPYITRVANGELEKLRVFGDDYDTKDGSGVRDYIHVMDLADEHVKALQNLPNGFDAINLGTGQGYSVLQMLKSFEKSNNVKVPYEIAPRRNGDVDACYAAVNKAQQKFGWKADRKLEDMCKSAWKFQNSK